MTNTIFKAVFVSLLISLPVCAAPDPLDAFPAAKANMQRIVIQLPDKSREEEANFKVELISGKIMMTDGVNQVRLGSSLSPHNLKGWGYTYYEVQQSAVSLSTMMAAPDGAPKIKQFVSGAPIMIRYNSRLPVVVYLPIEYELRYRIWEAPTQFQAAPQK